MGVNPDIEREANDFYATDPVAIDSQYLEKTLINKINKNKKLKNKVEKELSEDTGENFIEEEKITS